MIKKGLNWVSVACILVVYLVVTMPVAFASLMIDPDNLRFEEGTTAMNHVAVGGSRLNVTGVKVQSPVEINSSDVKMSGLGYSSVSATDCENLSGNMYECFWNNYWIEVGENADEVNLNFSVSNSAGQDNVEYLDFPLTVDEHRPEIEVLKTNNHIQNTSYFGPGSVDIIAVVNESQSGMEQKELFLDVTAISGETAQDALQANQCEDSTGKWYCYWYAVPVSADIQDGETKSVYVKTTSPVSKDDAGNVAEGITNGNFQYDGISPNLTSINYSTPVGTCATAGEPLTVNVTATDNSGHLYMKANFSSVSAENDVLETECDNTTSGFKCQLTFNNVLTGEGNEPVHVVVSDGVNEVEKTISVKLCKTNSSYAVPSCVSVNFDHPKTNPPKLDRKAASITDLPVTSRLRLEKCANSEIYEKKITCQAANENTSVSREQLLASYTEEPTLLMYFAGLPENEDSIRVDCQLETKLTVGTTVYLNPQVINLTFDIPLYNTPLGTIEESYQKKISELDKEINDLSEEIEGKESINKYFSTLCTVAQTTGAANSAMQDVKNLVYTSTCGLEHGYISGIRSATTTAISQVSKTATQNCGCCSSSNPGCCTLCGICSAAVSEMKPAKASLEKALAAHDQTQAVAPLDTMTAAAASCPPSGAGTTMGKAMGAYMSWTKTSAFWIKTCSFGNSFHHFVESYLWPSSWDITKPVGLVVKASCLVYTCRLCSSDFWGDFVVDLASGIKQSMSSPKPDADVPDSISTDYGWAGDLNYDVDTVNSDGEYTFAYSMASQKTDTDASDPATWLWMPYKSLQYAESCLCLPGIIYNLKKERQIKCMHKDCLQRTKNSGISSAYCDKTAQQRYCLYVQSAQAQLHGFWGSMFKQFTQSVMDNLPYIVAGVAYMAACPKYQLTGSKEECSTTYNKGICGPMSKSNLQAVFCGLVGAANSVKDIMDFISNGFSFDDYNAQLQGTDYCAQVGH